MPRLVEAVQSAGQIVTWVCDPMHGNTESVAGYKTRRYERIRQEVRSSACTFSPCRYASSERPSPSKPPCLTLQPSKWYAPCSTC